MMMNVGFQIREAVSNLRVAKMRSFLAILGILVGTASVVAMVSGGELATQQILSQFKSLGTNLLSVELSPAEQSGGRQASQTSVSVENILSLKELPGVELAAPYMIYFAEITFHGHELRGGEILATTFDFMHIIKLQKLTGRFVHLFDGYSHYVFIGNNIFTELRQHTVRPLVGEQINLGNRIFTIVGAAKLWKENPLIYEDINNSLIIPIRVMNLLSKYHSIRHILVRLAPGSDIPVVEKNIEQTLLRYNSNLRINFHSAQQIIESMRNQESVLTLFLGFIGSIALLVGGIGVMNIMLVSVTERRREIGIRMAIGAKGADIRSLFLIESLILSLFGGVLGVLSGVFISLCIALFNGWQFTLFIVPPLIGFIVSVSVGIFFGFYPAYRASKLDPITCLRNE